MSGKHDPNNQPHDVVATHTLTGKETARVTFPTKERAEGVAAQTTNTRVEKTK
jgi:hypothetical protein